MDAVSLTPMAGAQGEFTGVAMIKAYHESLKAHPQGSEDQALWEFYYRCRMLQDFVSGLTDQLAQDEYRTLSAL